MAKASRWLEHEDTFLEVFADEHIQCLHPTRLLTVIMIGF